VDWDAIQRLVERLQDLQAASAEWGDEWERARERLANGLRPLIQQMVRRHVWDGNLREDIAQEALLVILQKLCTYDRTRASFRAWASRVVINEICHQLRLEYGRPEVREADIRNPEDEEEDSGFLEEVADPDQPAHQQVAEKERLERIFARARATLSADEYLVWYEHLVNGTPYEEIARLLKRQQDWVRQTLHRAREKVAAAIVLDEGILSRDEIENAINRCQRSGEPLSEKERETLMQSIATSPRQSPGWRQLNLFRQACLKVLPHILSLFWLFGLPEAPELSGHRGASTECANASQFISWSGGFPA
jgi:RNA polymerase sigma factor (sigma-70 family)